MATFDREKQYCDYHVQAKCIFKANGSLLSIFWFQINSVKKHYNNDTRHDFKHQSIDKLKSHDSFGLLCLRQVIL